jgi:oligopeptidase B
MPDTLSTSPAAPQSPPKAERRPTVLETHGDRRVDDWAWLRNREDPDVLAHLEAENAWTAAQSAHLAPLRERLFEEIRARVVETDLSVPVRKGPWWYFGRTLEGSEYALHCRLPVSGEGRDPSVPPLAPEGSLPGETWPDEEVLLDENLLAVGHDYLDVANLAVSPDHTRLTYATDFSGDERFVLHVRSLDSGEEIDTPIDGTSYGVAWGDDTTLFYTRPDEANRPYQLWRHRVGDPAVPDVLVFEEPDERFHLGVSRTKNGAFVTLELQSKVTSEVHVLATRDPEGPWTVITPRRQGIEYGVEHHRGAFLLVTNEGAEDFRLIATPEDHPGETFQELIPARDNVRLEGIDVFDNHLVCYERSEGEARIRIHALNLAEPWKAPLGAGWLVPNPESPGTAWGGANPETSSPTLRYEYSSMVTPRCVLDLDLTNHHAVERKRQPVRGYDPTLYVTQRLWATAHDGTRIPISAVRHRDTPLDGSAPCLLYGYGSYEISIDPTFSSIRLSLLDRGVIYAIAHVRGGGELGRHWYEEGKLLAKPNTFTDFVSCAHHLVDIGWTRPDRLVGRGGSAGGLLMGAVANLAPELFCAIVAEVPFVDALTTILDDTLPLTIIEWEEWGNPLADPAVYATMKSYAPYDNVRPVRYPRMLVTGGLEDPRVGFWEPAKWVQRLRAAHPDNEVLLKMEMGAGHAGPSGRYGAWRDEAFVLAFILDAVGLAD